MKILPSPRMFAPALVLALANLSNAVAQTWVSSGLGGGGTQTSVAIQPGVSTPYTDGKYPVIITGADTNGINRSTDYGESWAGANIGTNPAGVPYVASVMWDPENNQIAYAATGDGLYESTDEGLNWFGINLDDTGAPLFVFNSNAVSGTESPGLPRWPRPIGNLLAIGGSGTRYLYAGGTENTDGGTNSGHVFRATDSGGDGNWVGWTEITPTSDGTSEFVDTPVNGIAIDPNRNYELFVAGDGSGIWYTSDAGSATTGMSNWRQLSSTIAYPQTLLVQTNAGGGSADALYVVGSTGTSGNGGIWYSTSPYTSLTPVPGSTDGSSPVSSATSWTALAGSYTDSTTVLYLGAAFPQSDGLGDGLYTPIVKGITTNGGTSWTWQSAATDGNTRDNIFNTNGQEWWMAESGGNVNYLLGGSVTGISNLQLDPNYAVGTSQHLFAAARSDLWSAGVTYSGYTPTVGTWFPDVGGYTDGGGDIGGGMGVKDCHGLAVDPNQKGYLYVGTPDWTFFYSTDSGASFGRNAPAHVSTDGPVSPIQTGDECKIVRVDPLNSFVACTTASESNFEGNVWFWQSKNPVPGTGAGQVSSWVDTGLGATLYTDDGFTDSGGYESGNEVQGMFLGRATDGTWSTDDALVCLAVLRKGQNGTDGGIWYGTSSENGSQGTWTWTQVNSTMNPAAGAVVQMAWHPSDKWVYAYEQQTGLWRSSDAGLNWAEFSQTWTDGTENWNWGLSSVQADTGYMVQDSNTDGGPILFLSAAIGTDSGVGVDPPPPGVYLIEAADTDGSGGPSFKQIYASTDGLVAGPLVFANGNLYCCCMVNGYTDGGLTPAQGEVLECTDAFASNPTWTPISNSTYSGQMNWAYSAQMDTDSGTIYVGSPEGVELYTTD